MLMSDMKDFLVDEIEFAKSLVENKDSYLAKELNEEDVRNFFEKIDYLYEMLKEAREKQFVFLWERGGKQFIKESKRIKILRKFKEMLLLAEAINPIDGSQDFLDCVAIDEERVKELIEEKEKVKE